MEHKRKNKNVVCNTIHICTHWLAWMHCFIHLGLQFYTIIQSTQIQQCCMLHDNLFLSPAEELKSPKPTQKPHPQHLPKLRQLAATDPDPRERVPSSGEWVHRGQADAIYYHTCDTIMIYSWLCWFIWCTDLQAYIPALVVSLYSMYFCVCP